MLREWLKLLRVRHYIKNLLVFLPLFFAGKLFDREKLAYACMGFICFCLLSSAIYVLNDYRDIEKDRKHPTKKNRPLASGSIAPAAGFTAMAVCLAGVVLLSVILGNLQAGLCLLLYFGLNLAYSMGLKNRPVIDIVILASGFVIRTFYGGFITGIEVSAWLYLVVTTGSLYLGLGKRRNELKAQTETREVLKYYNLAFLDKNMYVCVAMANVFYALWTLNMGGGKLIWTVPMFTVLLMCYSFDAENDSDGDPVEVIYHDRMLIGMILAYALCIFLMIYYF